MAARNFSRSSAISIAVRISADHLDAEALEGAILIERQRRVERRLSAHGGQQRVGAFGLDDLCDDIGRDRLDIGCIGHIRIGHDRRGIRIDQNDAIALFLESFASLGPGIIELARLADDNRAGANDHDGLDVCAFGHVSRVL